MSSNTAVLSMRHRASLAVLALMMIVPFVQPFHFQPIGSFYSEWTAGLLGLAATACVMTGPAAWREFPLPRIAAIPALLIAAMGLQLVWGRVIFPEMALIHALYLLWAALLACLGALLARDLGLQALAKTLAWAILLGGLLTSLAVWAQFIERPAPYWLVFPDNNPSSNLGQRNHAADYLWLGVVSAIYLGIRKSISMPALATFLVALVSGAVLTGSRGPVVYGLALAFLATWWWRQDRGTTPRTVLVLVAATVVAFLTGHSLLAAAGKEAIAVQRMSPAALAGDPRWAVWHDAWNMFLEAPWLGNGVGNYHWRSFEMASRAPHGAMAVPSEHAHNIILQWLADYGVGVTLVALTLLAGWARDALRRPLDADRWWLLGVVTVLAVHSQLEYPLWYAFFLAPAALLLGAANERVGHVSAPRGWAIYALSIAFGVVMMITLLLDFKRIETSAYWTNRLTRPPALAWTEMKAGLTDVAKSSLLSPVANLGIAIAMLPDRQRAADQLRVCRRAMAYQPQPEIVAKCAVLEGWQGNSPRSDELLRQVNAAYPGQQAELAEAVAAWRR